MLPSIGRAEVSEVRIVKQFGVHYLPLVIMEHEHIIERRAKEAGLADLKPQWVQLSGGAAINDALLSGSVDFVAGGTPPFMVLWDRTRGGKGDVRALAAMSDAPLTLNTNNDSVHGITDFTDKDKIALPAVGTSIQAIILQMAAAKQWGIENFSRLDRLTVSLPHPLATQALLSKSGEITAHFTVPPFDVTQLKQPGIHKVLDSTDVVGGSAISLLVIYGTSKFNEANPKVSSIVFQSLGEAMELIRSDKRKAAQMYLELSKDKISVDDLAKLLEDPKVGFSLTPSSVMQFADFLAQTKRIKAKPASWKDFFFSDAQKLPG
ncbi:MAG: ABC transporter substrate-binding protein, partial [Proteobacteria bacterium]|nr:ABC transporter substrate-binding protein [Pseudomonadota bacterium]